jgi:hypothetical protein
MSPALHGSDRSAFGTADAPGAGTDSTAMSTAALHRGDTAVFALDGTGYEKAGVRRLPVGFTGVLMDTWENWSVFGCIRAVAEEVVADHRRNLARERAALRALGYTGSDLDARFAASTIRMWFDGEYSVIDERRLHADRAAISRSSPDPHGLYVIRGYVWPWICVDPADCDRVIGQNLAYRSRA